MNGFVVDASAAVKWFIPEVHAIPALRLLEGDHYLLAPDLLLSEVGNILWKKCRRGELEAPQAEEILRDLRRSTLAIRPAAPLLEAAWEIAVRHQRTFYDSLYLALAVTAGVPLVTADEKFLHAMLPTPLANLVLWVGDLP